MIKNYIIKCFLSMIYHASFYKDYEIKITYLSY